MKPRNYKVKETHMITKWALRENVSDRSDAGVDISSPNLFVLSHCLFEGVSAL